MGAMGDCANSLLFILDLQICATKQNGIGRVCVFCNLGGALHAKPTSDTRRIRLHLARH